MSPLDLNAIPNPANSPIEKLLPDTMWENIEPRIRDSLSENPTRDEILRAFSYYDRVMADYIQRHERQMTYWANIHTHPGTGAGGGSPFGVGEWIVFPVEGSSGANPLYSSDGDTWVEGSPTPSGTRVAAGWDPVNEQYLLVTPAGVYANSDVTGSSWTLLSSLSLTGIPVVSTQIVTGSIEWYSELGVYLITYPNTVDAPPLWSADLVTWTPATASGSGVGRHRLIAYNGTTVLWGASGNASFFYSSDGKTFTRDSSIDYTDGITTYAGSYWWAGGGSSAVQYSSDGLSWTSSAGPAGLLTVGAQRGLPSGYGVKASEVGIFTTPDGITLTQRISYASRYIDQVLYDGQLWVVIGQNGTLLTSSDNGVTWEQAAMPGGYSTGYRFAVGACAYPQSRLGIELPTA